jgi:hypothetical protein
MCVSANVTSVTTRKGQQYESMDVCHASICGLHIFLVDNPDSQTVLWFIGRVYC